MTDEGLNTNKICSWTCQEENRDIAGAVTGPRQNRDMGKEQEEISSSICRDFEFSLGEAKYYNA